MTQQQNKAPRRQTIEQERGREAWKNIKDIKRIAKDYRPLARSLNAMIQINGLGQTLGFFYAKSKKDNGQPDREKAHYQLLKHLTDWIRWMRDNKYFSAANANKISNEYYGLLSWVLDKDTSTSDYRRATTECLAFGQWLSRFAEAELSEGTSSTGGTSGGTGNG